MPAIMEERVEKVFMNILKSKILILLVMLAGCTPELDDDPIPYIPFNEIFININLPEYTNLRMTGGFQEINGGVRGIILYRKDQNNIFAFERNCSFQPNQACATVNVHSSGLFMTDPCCNSNFSFNEGFPTSGPAWRPLRMYRSLLNGTFLTITDEIVN